ncbi:MULTISPECIES: hypothetical protein [unclassified Rhodococcus (in: high G+C Gram-positive bacteria)]|uniref:hypothetical protein n=1 Tax=unclassified Rhodococcus (in: high G+C Gram-positive bacteria) TaxID=192944 RepID=UPI00114054E9|nr:MULTISPECIES: hypothetical protein [unclassified Rhodococcus (in: high G+C Gram-positive bacteria)]
MSRELPEWLIEELHEAKVDLTDPDAIEAALEKRLRRHGEEDPESIGFPHEYYEGVIEIDDVEIDDVTVLPAGEKP